MNWRDHRRKDLLSREPLFKPPFGPPVNGRLCPKCEQWYDRAVFWRPGGRANGHYIRGHYVKTCLRCLETAKNPRP